MEVELGVTLQFTWLTVTFGIIELDIRLNPSIVSKVPPSKELLVGENRRIVGLGHTLVRSSHWPPQFD